MNIEGLKLTTDYLSETQATDLLRNIDASPWLDDLKRRVQHYGYKYDYRARAVDTSMFLGPLPDWAGALAQRLYKEKVFEAVPDQVIVNEYLPGQGIAPHVDCEPCFAGTIAGLTLGSGCLMDFTHLDEPVKISHHLSVRSLVVLQGEARYRWRHGIAGRKTDLIDGRRVPRGRRVSLTFRNVILQQY